MQPTKGELQLLKHAVKVTIEETSAVEANYVRILDKLSTLKTQYARTIETMTDLQTQYDRLLQVLSVQSNSSPTVELEAPLNQTKTLRHTGQKNRQFILNFCPSR
ncbi:MAG: hypothetical protein N5P05_002450 [Chroococcopsis gigantea SAG 12.99]|jgi:regulator of replication initiation timing|nr:hypothetical protein [Chroococcopsis gigantea SAG 12.99]